MDNLNLNDCTGPEKLVKVCIKNNNYDFIPYMASKFTGLEANKDK